MRYLTIPEYAREKGRLADYEAFVDELRSDPVVRFTVMRGGKGWVVPAVEVPTAPP